MVTQWIDSVPAWALGPRSSNSKFGGNIILAGIPEVSERLVAVTALSRKLGLAGDEALRSSGHILLEVKTVNRKYQRHNAPGAISFRDLKAGIRSGKFPRWVAMTAPQFGFKGAERGGMISKNPADREMARELHLEAITRSQELADAGLGAGINIWWPAWASRKVDDPKNPPMEFQKAWETMLAFWVELLRFTGGTMWLEWKPGDPGIDYLMTLELAIKFCEAVNRALGRKAMLINNEFAHILISGISVEEGVHMTVAAGLFSEFVHANSGQRMPVRIQSLLDSGTRPEDILIGTDWDWAVGVGGQATWDDQQRAIGIMDRASQKVIHQNVMYCEHDVNPSGLDPLKVFQLSIHNRRKMLAAARAA
ncbi:MAG: hypothetical protein ABSF55_01835 [Candidatus Staskawiczbacteria bacterium]|jgi:hypothetical protein